MTIIQLVVMQIHVSFSVSVMEGMHTVVCVNMDSLQCRTEHVSQVRINISNYFFFYCRNTKFMHLLCSWAWWWNLALLALDLNLTETIGNIPMCKPYQWITWIIRLTIYKHRPGLGSSGSMLFVPRTHLTSNGDRPFSNLAPTSGTLCLKV